MEYVKGKPYFCYCNEKIKQYRYLGKDIKCEILIIGGGIDGAIANYYFSKDFNVVLVDKGRLGMSCTACATALLECQLDDFAEDLLKHMTEGEIVLAYKMGIDAKGKINNFIKTHGNYCNFALRPTFLYTNSFFSIKSIKKEYEFKIKNGFNCKIFDSNNSPFTFPLKCGIYAENGGGEFNPYLFTKQMIENSKNQNSIFENTNIVQLIKNEHGYISVANFGEKIYCEKVIIATGFNWEVLGIDDLCERFITYSIVTSPLKDFTWLNKALIHDVESPYHYLRTLPDGRIIYGGEDTIFKEKPINEKVSNKKYDKLGKDLFRLYPEIEGETKIEYKFCGCFGSTPNNLGLIGESKIDDDILLFISCGANGIINAMAGVDVIKDILLRKNNPLIPLFSP